MRPESPPFALRPAKDADAEDIARLFIHTRETCLPYLQINYDQLTMIDLFRNQFLPNQNVWVAVIGQVILGFMALEGDELDRLYVLPKTQGMGVGRALLDKAKELSPKGLSLWVFQQNEQARRFYERNGFKLERLTDGRGNMEKTPDARYQWKP